MSANEKLIFRKGALIFLSEEEYSDYGIIGHFLVLRKLDFQNELSVYQRRECTRQARDKQVRSFYANYGGFIQHLIRKKLIKRTRVNEVHLGSYNTWSPSLKLPDSGIYYP